MSEAESTIDWVVTMSCRYGWHGNPEQIALEFEGTTVEEREGVQYLYEWMWFEGLIPLHPTG
jgi:hypothetical protein